MPHERHGLGKHYLYKTWTSMRSRCTNPNVASYHCYGGRGVKVCKRWDSFSLFLEDMGDRPSKSHTLDRYPNKNGDYEPGNVRWATPIQQGRNKTDNTIISYNGKTKTLGEWAELSGLSNSVISHRLKSNWPPDKIFTTPPNEHFKIKPKDYPYIISQLGKKPLTVIAEELNVSPQVIGTLINSTLKIKVDHVPQKSGKEHPRSKKFKGINLLTGERKIFYSLQEASRYIDGRATLVCKVLQGKGKTTKKWSFKYV